MGIRAKKPFSGVWHQVLDMILIVVVYVTEQSLFYTHCEHYLHFELFLSSNLHLKLCNSCCDIYFLLNTDNENRITVRHIH